MHESARYFRTRPSGFDVARTAGITRFIVEHDRPARPFESIQT
jgi:hypothetical protein